MPCGHSAVSSRSTGDGSSFTSGPTPPASAMPRHQLDELSNRGGRVGLVTQQDRPSRGPDRTHEAWPPILRRPAIDVGIVGPGRRRLKRRPLSFTARDGHRGRVAGAPRCPHAPGWCMEHPPGCFPTANPRREVAGDAAASAGEPLSRHGVEPGLQRRSGSRCSPRRAQGWFRPGRAGRAPGIYLLTPCPVANKDLGRVCDRIGALRSPPGWGTSPGRCSRTGSPAGACEDEPKLPQTPENEGS